ncbi:multiple coagulation factor deficiency protein 2 homolog isoform X2 [Aethina tumida]|uniref:multiple coagulation factor deficiency protein 2 homolog isoform X2 n=1 Tax=Aethina tumida TaxID=116153 RepID=UPI00096B0D3C|nr:multiple coagulation factor deficiency protein 2 homolog isoform X2 [Aethina tumida]
MKILICLCLILSVNHVISQRVAPGVPPQQYRQPQQQQVYQQPQQQYQQVHQQQYQQVPQQQYQQVPVQQVPVQQHVPVQQQVPVQQVPVQQVPVQQVPVQQVPHGHGHHGQQQILNTANLAHEKEHIAEHFDVPIDTSKMTEQELQFHYFKMHDADNNNKLDGCELIKSLIHWHGPSGTTKEILSDENLQNMVDDILKLMDKNSDGFIDYTEYKISTQSTTGS